ncbi:C40 family peptidase [Ureibacillus terrenus]|uniref:Peptidase n=1 Tax=Ureibacillus terrenus TaxID=118246 RepID=A0A540V5N2_9BACL|nr:C40 family peptidase [Ureibacillus terrenus]TQE91443.1 peptidase [Ureibacillus terrenus]
MKKRWLIPVFASFMIAASPVVDAEAATTQQLITTAKQYIGVPYLWGGTTAKGFDCSGYVQRVFADLGIELNRTSAAQYTQGVPVSRQNLQIGDLVFFNTSGSGVSHVGIYIGNNEFINSSSSKGVSIASLDSSYWNSRYVGARRIADFSSSSQVKPASVDFSVYASREKAAFRLAEALGLDTSDTRSPFADVKPTDKVAGAVTALNKLKVFEGNESGKFNPNSPITRAQMAKVLVAAFDLKPTGSQPVRFSDVDPDHWAAGYISILAQNGITVGKGNGQYGPNDYVTIKQLETFLSRAMSK